MLVKVTVSWGGWVGAAVVAGGWVRVKDEAGKEAFGIEVLLLVDVEVEVSVSASVEVEVPVEVAVSEEVAVSVEVEVSVAVDVAVEVAVSVEVSVSVVVAVSVAVELSVVVTVSSGQSSPSSMVVVVGSAVAVVEVAVSVLVTVSVGSSVQVSSSPSSTVAVVVAVSVVDVVVSVEVVVSVAVAVSVVDVLDSVEVTVSVEVAVSVVDVLSSVVVVVASMVVVVSEEVVVSVAVLDSVEVLVSVAEVDVAVLVGRSHSPVVDGTAFAPLPMATRFEPHSMDWAMWTLRLSQSKTTYAARRKVSPSTPAVLSYAPRRQICVPGCGVMKSLKGTEMTLPAKVKSTDPPRPWSEQSTAYRSALGKYVAEGKAATSLLKTAVGRPVRGDALSMRTTRPLSPACLLKTLTTVPSGLLTAMPSRFTQYRVKPSGDCAAGTMGSLTRSPPNFLVSMPPKVTDPLVLSSPRRSRLKARLAMPPWLTRLSSKRG